MQGYTT